MDGADTRVSVMKTYVGSEVEFVGRVGREPEMRTQNMHLHVAPKIEGVYDEAYVLVSLDRFAHQDMFAYGDEIRVVGELTLPEEFETDGGRYFNYPGYLRAKNIETIVYDAQVERVSVGEPSVFRTLYAYKSTFMESLESILPHPHAGLGEGILLGVKRALGEDLEEAFRKTGIIHIVVLSGYNVLIVVEAMMLILAYFFRPKIRMLFGLTWIVTFAFLVGLSATVVRASIMAGLLLIARTTGRTYAILRALVLTGVVMIGINPHILLYDVGFQLSFLATLGLIVCVPYFEKRFTRVPSTLGLRGIVSATIATQILVLPLLLYQTGMLSLVSVVVNVLVLPIVPLAMLLTFLAGVAGLVSASFGTALGFLAYGSLNYIIKIAEWFAELPLSAKTVDAFPFWMVIVGYIGVTVWYVRVVRGDEDVPKGVVDVTNDYDGWVIEEEENLKKRDTSPLPFR
jgi:competence protein ComEC